MCGIVGFIGANANENIALMCNAIRHRGPDNGGVFYDENLSLAMGHRRLSIIDLSETGSQPMHSQDGRYVIVHNGEIYNHHSLRKQALLKEPGLKFRGTSDTESLLEAIAVLGLEKTLQLCIGMFAFALYDKKLRKLSFARDRAGEKPLYYGWHKGNFFFMSDLISLHAIGISPEINRSALQLYCNHGYFPTPYTVFENVYKLPPAQIMTISTPFDQVGDIKPYWDVYQVAMHAQEHPFSGSRQDAVDNLSILLNDAVRGQMVSDMPLGAFLSGGIDSSLIVATMQQLSNQKIKTFSIGFNEAEANEAVYAKAVAEHLGTDHTEMYITAQDALDVIPNLPRIYAEPFADSSQIPTYLVSKLARSKVSVSLSGDAGDELFGGYNSYFKIPAIYAKAKKLILRNQLASIALWASATPLGKLYSQNRLYGGGLLLRADTYEQAYAAISGYWCHKKPLVLDAGDELIYAMNQPETCPPFKDMRRTMMDLDFRMYLPDDILVKVDRSAMAVSLETRVPLLDHRIIEFAWSLPTDYKFYNGVRKWPMRELLYRSVPQNLIERPKRGFSIPVNKWLTGPLRDWVGDSLAPEKIKRQGYFRSELVQAEWKQVQKNPGHNGASIWVVLMFQAWLDAYRSGGAI